MGYRHFDRHKIEPLFPFGHGLSYTAFVYSNLETTVLDPDGSFTIAFDVSNTGPIAGTEVSMVFVSDPVCSVPRPVKELKGFASTGLKSGETRRITLKMDKWALGFWQGGEEGQWVAEAGDYEIRVGGGPNDLPLTAIIPLKQTLTWLDV